MHNGIGGVKSAFGVFSLFLGYVLWFKCLVIRFLFYERFLNLVKIYHTWVYMVVFLFDVVFGGLWKCEDLFFCVGEIFLVFSFIECGGYGADICYR